MATTERAVIAKQLEDILETSRTAEIPEDANAADLAVLLYRREGVEYWEHNGRVVDALLKENTGSHFLDSGGAYGRNWEANQSRDFEAESSAEFSLRFYGDGHDAEFRFFVRLYAWMQQNLNVEPGWNALFHKIYVPLADEGLDWWQRKSWEELLGGFYEWLIGLGFEVEREGGDNTYNHENTISQGFNWHTWRVELVPEEFSELLSEYEIQLVQVHGGCDVRGGYTRPIFFNDGDQGIYNFNDGSIYCADYQGCDSRWYYDGRKFGYEGPRQPRALLHLEDYRIRNLDCGHTISLKIWTLLPYFVEFVWSLVRHMLKAPKYGYPRNLKTLVFLLKQYPRHYANFKRRKFGFVVGQHTLFSFDLSPEAMLRWWRFKEALYHRWLLPLLVFGWRLLRAKPLPESLSPQNIDLLVRRGWLGLMNRLGVGNWWVRHIRPRRMKFAIWRLRQHEALLKRIDPERTKNQYWHFRSEIDQLKRRLEYLTKEMQRVVIMSIPKHQYSIEEAGYEQFTLTMIDSTDRQYSITFHDANGVLEVVSADDVGSYELVKGHRGRTDRFIIHRLDGRQWSFDFGGAYHVGQQWYPHSVIYSQWTFDEPVKLKFDLPSVSKLRRWFDRAYKYLDTYWYWFARDKEQPTCPVCRKAKLDAGL